MFRNGRRGGRTAAVTAAGAAGGAWLVLGVVLAQWSAAASAVSANRPDPFAEVTIQFSREPEDMILARRSQAVLDCSAASNGSQDAVISWRKDGEALVPGTRRTVYSNGSLVIRHFAKQQGDEGAYECVATVGNRALVSRRALLQEAALGTFSGHPRSMEVPLGGNARFECVITGIPKPNITWRRNGRSLIPSERLVHVTSGVLQLTNVTSADVGSYSCQASSFGHERTSESAELTLGSANKEVRILWSPVNQEVELGATATFECLPSRAGHSVLWSRKDGAALPLLRSRTFGSGNLEIREVQANDSADYSCQIVNGPSTAAAAAAQAKLTVTVPPKFVNFSKTGKETRAQTIRITCRFSGGQPPPAISWTKNGRPVASFRRVRVQGNTLVITQTMDSDSALYQCWAENSVGRVGGIIPLTIVSSEDDPNPPTSLRAYSIETRSVELTWDPPPDTNLSLVGYSIHAWAVFGNGGEIQEVAKQPPKKILNLQPFTNYTFFVRAYSSVGASEPSEDIYVVTREDVPLDAPLVSLFPLTPTSLNVSWQKLSLQQARGTIVEYRLFYRKQTDTAREITIPGNILDHTLTGLETDETYSVRVLAGTRAGFPRLDDDQWPWVSWVASESAHTGVNPLSNVNVRIVSATEVNITWDYPVNSPLNSEGGVLIEYNLVGQPPKMIVKTEEDTGHLLYGLQPDSVYEFKIGMIANSFDEEIFYRQTIRTPPLDESHSAPVILEVNPVNETAIELSWQMPGSEVDPAIYYSVVYFPTAAGSDGEKMFLNSTGTSVVLTGLMPMTEYKILVQSHTADGPGPFSSAVTCHTDEGRPPALLHLTWFLQAPTVVQLNWKMPPLASGIISRYVVSYCEDKITSDDSWKTRVENGSFCYTVLHGLKGRTVYRVRMHAENGKGAGPASSVRVITGVPDDEESSSNERLMGVVIGIGISGGCIIICVIIILLRNRCFPPPSPPRGSLVMMQRTNGFATPLHCNGYVASHTDARCDVHEPDGTTPMLTQDPDTIDNKPEVTTPRQVDLWSSVDDGRRSLTDRSTTVV